MGTFVVIDFETANHSRDSACAIGLAVCTNGRVIETPQFLIQPLSRTFAFTYIHGIQGEDVARAPRFNALARRTLGRNRCTACDPAP